MYTRSSTTETNRYYSGQSLERVAHHLYDKTRGSSLLANLKQLFGEDSPSQLYTLREAIRKITIHGQKAIGLKTVDISQILGTVSEGRARDFDIDFRPLQEHNKERWLGVAAAWLSGRRLDPVKLVQVGDFFFVEDGHHRISVAWALGEQKIEAEVVMLLGTGMLSIAATEDRNKTARGLVLQPAAA